MYPYSKQFHVESHVIESRASYYSGFLDHRESLRTNVLVFFCSLTAVLAGSIQSHLNKGSSPSFTSIIKQI